MKITMADIRNRLSKVSTQYSKPASLNGQRLYEQAVNTRQGAVVRRALSNWESLAESDISSLSKLLDIYDAVAESGNIGLLKTMTTTICEDAIPKIRNGMETNNLIKHRTSRFKTKIQTKIQNKINDIEDLVDGKKISDAQAAISAAQQSKTIAQANGEKDNGIEQTPQEECYNRLIEAADKVISCDRVIENYNSLSKRFNIDKVICENASLGIYDTVFEVCKLIDTYNIPFKVKYNTALESCVYGLSKNGIQFENKNIVSGCSDYFLCSCIKEDYIKSEFKESSLIYEGIFDRFKSNKNKNTSTEINHMSDEERYDYVDSNEMSKIERQFKKDYNDAIKIIRPLIKNQKAFSIASFDYSTSAADDYWGKSNYIDLVDWDLYKFYENPRFQMKEDGCAEFNDVYNSITNALKDFASKRGYTFEDSGDWDGGTIVLVKKGHAYKLKESVKIKTTNYLAIKEEMRKILEDAQLFDPETDYEDVEYITEDPEDNEEDLPDFEEYVEKNIKESNIISEYDMIHEKEIKKFAKSVAKANKNEVKDLINSIKALPDKTPEKIKAIIRKIYSKSPEQVIDGTPNLLTWLRVGLVCSTITTIGPATAIVAFIVDQFIAMTVKRKDAERMVKKFVSDIDATKKKIEKTKDEEEKKRLEEYLKTLIKQTDRLVEYRDSLHTDDENMERPPETYDDSDDDFDLDDFDFDIDESYSFNTFAKDMQIVSKRTNDFQNKLIECLEKFDYESSDILAECLAAIPGIVNRDVIIETYNELINKERSKPGIEKYQKIDVYNNAKYTLEHTSPIAYDAEDPYTSIKVFQAMNEVYSAIDMVSNCQPTVMNELSFGNTLKMAREKLKKGISKLSDTEKAASRTIDMSADKIEKNIERSMSSSNREAIIKGSILPSASNCLKTALAAGATAVLIHPVVAIIGVLGKMACSKKYKAKERQLILDEIEVELQMVDKYLKVAEDKNDMQATKHLLTTKRTLERERQRIKYKMNVQFKQHVPNTKESDYDNY